MTSDRTGSLWCRDETRKGRIAESGDLALNGIDFVEYGEDWTVPEEPEFWLVVTFLKTPPDDLKESPKSFLVTGGVRIVGIRSLKVEAIQYEPLQLRVFLDRCGDSSTYVLHVSHEEMDPRLSSEPFSFKIDAPSQFDCRREVECPPEAESEPELDYLAKDYASFRRLLLDLIPQRNPRWLERNPADLGMALVELLAYEGDRLSYFQDAVANEAYLDTCRQRVSAKRHARLIDYRMHDGRNAWTYVHIRVDSAGTVPQQTKLLTPVTQPLRGQPAPPGTVIPPDLLDFEGDPALRDVEVFETTAPVEVRPEHHELRIHTWGNRECCLARGTREAHLYGVAANGQAYRPTLKPGDYTLYEEVKGPTTGLAADADRKHRQVVRLVDVAEGEDPLYCDMLDNGKLVPRTEDTDPSLPLLKVVWREEDALTFPLCLSATHEDGSSIEDVSVAQGNVVPSDHGRSVSEVFDENELEDLWSAAPADHARVFRLTLSKAPLTFQATVDPATFDKDGFLQEPRHDLDVAAPDAAPSVILVLRFSPDDTEVWTPVPHLFDSGPLDPHFVADVDDDGRAVLRFGDDDYGRRPLGAIAVTARYRIGNGPRGNIGSGSLVHAVSPVEGPGIPPGAFPNITEVRQPLPARAGQEPEAIEEVRQLAPHAVHAEQFRAVTEEDYEAAARKLSEVADGKCTFRWTGSWHSVFVAVHPRSEDDLVIAGGGNVSLSDQLARKVRGHLARYRLAGYDLEVRAARYVPLHIEIELWVAPGHFRGDVLQGVTKALSNRRHADGTLGFFHAERLSFGHSIYLSQVYGAVTAVAGVESAVVRVFKRFWQAPSGELEKGVVAMGPWEVPRLDNDPNFPENGLLTLEVVGGS